MVMISSVISLCKGLEAILNGTEDIKFLEFKFNYIALWAFGGALMEKNGIDYQKNFSDFWKSSFKGVVKHPNMGTVFDNCILEEDDTICIS
jgi:dynein heavy chain